ncbi:MAG TPA: DUF4865 family protein [Dongiaceae bacterium]|jgi:hypothetical protein|nr:DUF4865 family protein [Dongiaceae bacterium]
MLAMHYRIRLADDAAVVAVRQRARERGPLFDGMRGLAEKLFLVDPVRPCYATFYLWREPDAALDFLEGPFFKALSDTFGRPEVRLLLTGATALPGDGRSVALITGAVAHPLPAGAVEAIDPHDGSTLVLMPSISLGRRFEVMYHARGDRRAAAQ